MGSNECTFNGPAIVWGIVSSFFTIVIFLAFFTYLRRRRLERLRLAELELANQQILIRSMNPPKYGKDAGISVITTDIQPPPPVYTNAQIYKF